MLIFPKPFKVPASFLVWTFPRAFAFHTCINAPRSVPRVRPEVIIYDDVNVKVFIKYILIHLRFLLCTRQGPFLEHWLLLCATLPLVRPQGGARGQYLG